MACGQFHVQSRGILWVLSTVYLERAVLPLFGGTKRSTQAAFNLVIQRPRIAGGSLTIPLDSNAKILPCFGNEISQNTLRLQYGVHGKCILMRASSAVELQKWAAAVMTAVAATQDSAQHVPVPATVQDSRETASKMPTTKTNLRCAKKMEIARSSVCHARISPQEVLTPRNCTLRQVVRQIVPSAMQFFITVGQIIASAS